MTIIGNYVPSTAGWVRDQVELYERTGGKEGSSLRETGIGVIIVTMIGGKPAMFEKLP